MPARRDLRLHRADIAREYESGVSSWVLAKRYGVTDTAIRYQVRAAGGLIKPRGNRYREWTPKELDDIASRWRGGESQRAIALEHGTHQTIISRLLIKMGIVPEARIRHSERHGSWKGGRVQMHGYIGVRTQRTDPYRVMGLSTGYVLEHRLVMARSLGRPLEPHETVHHINGDKADNRLENLQLRNGKHGRGHALVCLDCGSHNIGEVHIAD